MHRPAPVALMSNLQNPRAALEESFGGGGEREAARPSASVSRIG